MEGVSKQIKWAFVVDRESARAAAGVIDDLFRRVTKLGDAMARVGGGSLGNNGFVSTGRADPSVAGRTPGKFTYPGAAGGGRGQGGLIQNFLGVGDAGALRQLVQGTEQAFQRIGSDIRGFVDRAESDMRRLRTSVGSINVPQGASYVHGYGLMPKGGMPGGGGGGGGAVGHGGGGSMLGALGGVGQNALGQVGLGPLGQGLGALGASTPAMMIGGMGGAAIGGLGMFLGARQQNLIANLDYQVNQPIRQQQQLAGAASISAGLYHAARQGDIKFGLAYNDVAGDARIQAAVKSDARRELERRRAEVEGVTAHSGAKRVISAIGGFSGDGSNPSLSDFGKAALNPLRMIGLGVNMGLTGLAAADTTAAAERRRTIDLERERIDREMPMRQAQAQAEAIAAKQAMMGRIEDVSQNIQSGWRGMLHAQRLRGGGTMRRPDGSRMDAAEDYEYRQFRLLQNGWSVEDEAGGTHALITGAGSAYARRIGGTRVPSAAMAGVGNLVGMIKAGGILGGGVGAGVGASRLFGGGGIAGSRGMDAVTASELVASLQGRMMGLGAAGGFTGNTADTFIRAAAGLVSGGGALDVGMQGGNIAMLNAGLGAMGGLTSGKTAGLYEAHSVLASMHSAGGFGALSEKLREADPAVLMAMARGGAAPPQIAALLGSGQTGRGVAKDFLRQMRRSPFFEVGGALAPGGDTAAGKLISKIRHAEDGGGDFTDVFASEISGLKGAARGQRLRELNQVAGSVAVGGAEALMAMEIADPRFAPTLKAGGVGVGGPAGTLKQAAMNEAYQHAKDSDTIMANLTDVLKKLTTAFGKLGGEEAKLKMFQDASGMNLPSGVQMKLFVQGIEDATRALRNLAGSGMVRAR